MKHTISVIVENQPGVLHRVAGLFARRGFNIDSLAVGETENPKLSRITIVVAGDDQVLEQIQKQLYKLIDVIKVFDLPPEKSVDREAILIKVAINAQNRAEVTEVVELFSAKIVEATDDTLTIEALAESEKITGFIKMLKKFGIKEMVQTGKIALLKGESSKK